MDVAEKNTEKRKKNDQKITEKKWLTSSVVKCSRQSHELFLRRCLEETPLFVIMIIFQKNEILMVCAVFVLQST